MFCEVTDCLHTIPRAECSEKGRPGSVPCTGDRQHWTQGHACRSSGCNQEAVLKQSRGMGRALCWAQKHQERLPGDRSCGGTARAPSAVTMHRKVSKERLFCGSYRSYLQQQRPRAMQSRGWRASDHGGTAARHREREKQKTKHHQSEQGYWQGNYSPTDEYTEVKSKLNME